MHSAFITILAAMLVFAIAIGLGSSRTVEVFTLSTLVAVIGVPHGALDHVVGQRLFRPTFGQFWGTAFFSIYLAIAVIVVWGWYALPVLTILAFFVFSAWHFGLEERDDQTGNWTRHLTAIASGGLIIWLPSLCRGDDVVELLSIITPTNQDSAIADCVAIVAKSAIVMIPLCILDCLQRDLQVKHTGQGLVELIATSNSLRMLSLALLCIVASPLVSFTVYFCGWHSVRGLNELARAQGESAVVMFRKLLPLTITALGLVTIGAVFWSSTSAVESSLIRTVFIGLSAMAVPHLCLHVVDDALSLPNTNLVTSNVELLNRA